MDLTQYSKDTIKEFKGLYKRGMADNCPQDHAICCENVSFTKSKEVLQRDGMIVSMNAGHPVVRMFLAVLPGIGATKLLTLDESGNIYQDSNPSPIYSYGPTVDFSALNIGGRTYILPISSPGSSPANIQVWDGVSPTTRDAGCLPPSATFSAADGSAGNIDVGDYQIAVSFITDSGFTSPPGPAPGAIFTPVLYSAPGSKQINITGLPTGGPEVIARQILITRANELEFFFLGISEGGLVNDNVTTTATLDFFDTDLNISADYLFDIFSKLTAGVATGNLIYYHSRMIVTRTSNVVLASRVQDQESISQVDGLIQVPTEGGQLINGVCQQRDILYCLAFPGIYNVEDNTLEPAFWPITLVDGGVGSFGPGIGTLSGTSNALSSRGILLFSDRNGLFKFDGSVDGAALSWKIDDLWKQINFDGAPEKVSVYIDIFHDIFYVLAPIGNATLPSMLLMADYSEGLDWQNIKWSYWTFPYELIAATIIYYTGNLEPGAGGYYLRLAFQDSNEFIYAIKPNLTTDQGAMINSYYTCYLGAPGNDPGMLGNVNFFRNTRLRAQGQGPLRLQLNNEDFDASKTKTPPDLTLSNTAAKDLNRQIKFTNEKMSLTFGVNPDTGTAGNNWKVSRVDIWGRRELQARPQ